MIVFGKPLITIIGIASIAVIASGRPQEYDQTTLTTILILEESTAENSRSKEHNEILQTNAGDILPTSARTLAEEVVQKEQQQHSRKRRDEEDDEIFFESYTPKKHHHHHHHNHHNHPNAIIDDSPVKPKHRFEDDVEPIVVA